MSVHDCEWFGCNISRDEHYTAPVGDPSRELLYTPEKSESEFPFGLDEHEIETLVRFAAAALHAGYEGADRGDPYLEALTSFSDPAEVQDLGFETWQRISP